MDIYLFGFIIITIGCLVVTIITMYAHSHKLQSTIVELEDELNNMYECHVSESNPWELADTLEAKLKLSQTSRRIQKEEIKELKEELIELEKELQKQLFLEYSS